MVKNIYWFGILFAIVVGLALSGCAHTVSTPEEASPPLPETIVQPTPGAPSDYIIGAGDILEISVWKDPALTRQVVVLPDGTFSFPLVGRVTAAGKTVKEISAAVEAQLTRYIPEPDLSVIVQQVNSQVLYVIGKVNRPGHIPLNRNVDVLQALSMAGGLNVFADEKNIRIFRRTENQTMVIPFNYKAVTEENRLEENIFLQRGDVIVVK